VGAASGDATANIVENDEELLVRGDVLKPMEVLYHALLQYIAAPAISTDGQFTFFIQDTTTVFSDLGMTAMLLYPYFWSHPGRWELKKYLDHPDAMHRAFLKAGSARVVLTIRPGFERAFVSFLETGKFDGVPEDHPYMKIAEEVQSYARINYPGIPPANAEEADVIERGKRIGTWYEHTPTSAMDIAFDETLPGA
jgi:hypothetical protein